ncbi:MAG TPA: hypothetical protein VGL53_01240 [Bryobacteraceae bacterium]|jgi:hypothetical protein
MKIRLFGDSIRLRLNQAEVESLAAGGAVEMVIPFPGEAFACTVQPSGNSIEVRHSGGRLSILIPQAQTTAWAASAEVGMYADQQPSSGGAVLRVLIEKDYRCVHNPDAPDNAGTFPNPLAASGE